MLYNIKERKRLWLTTAHVLGWQHSNISLPMQYDESGSQLHDGTFPTGILEYISLFGFKRPIYSVFLGYMRKRVGNRFHAYAYDWRREIGETSHKFEMYLDKIKQEYGRAPRIIAHSMGGLITWTVLVRRPELIDSIVFAGVPFVGNPSFLEDVHDGYVLGFNRTMMKPHVSKTFPSIYTLFPIETKQGTMVSSSGESIDVDFYDPDHWIENRMGAYRQFKHWSTTYQKSNKEFLRVTLTKAKRIRSIIHNEKPTRFPPISVIAGDSVDTRYSVMVNGPAAKNGLDFETRPMCKGDGRVPLEDACPPAGTPHSFFTTNMSHGAVLDDLKVLEKALDALQSVPGPHPEPAWEMEAEMALSKAAGMSKTILSLS
eukprot:Clim_evm58s203 gene=Clim_evmTU58s203